MPRSLVTQPPAAASQPANPNVTYENLGYGTDGLQTTVTSNASANTKGSYATIGTTANAWAAFWLDVGPASVSTGRFLIDIRIAGATIILPDFFIMPGAVLSGQIRIPLQVPTGTLIEARCQSSAGSSPTLKIAVRGEIASATTAPGFTQATALNVDTANTRPSTTNVPLQSTGPTWTQLVASTAATYGAIVAVLHDAGTNHTTAQNITAVIATGAAASEAEYSRLDGFANNATSAIQRGQQLFQKSIPSGTRLSSGALATTPNSDNVRVGLYGFA